MRWEHTGTCMCVWCVCVCAWIVCVCCSLKTKLIKISLELTKWPNAVTFNRRQVALDKLPNLNIYVYIYFMRTISHCYIEAEAEAVADWLSDVLPASISLLTSSQLAINLDIETAIATAAATIQYDYGIYTASIYRHIYLLHLCIVYIYTISSSLNCRQSISTISRAVFEFFSQYLFRASARVIDKDSTHVQHTRLSIERETSAGTQWLCRTPRILHDKCSSS